MRELWFWRGATAVAVVGWGLTAWSPWSAPPPEVPTPAQQVARVPSRPPLRPPGRRLSTTPPPSAEAAAAEAPGAALSEDALQVAREQLHTEIRSRQSAFAERMLGARLDQIADFAEAHSLSADTQADLEDAQVTLHEQLLQLRPADALSPVGPPSPEVREAFQEAFEVYGEEVRAILGEDLSEAFFDLGPRRP